MGDVLERLGQLVGRVQDVRDSLDVHPEEIPYVVETMPPTSAAETVDELPPQGVDA